MMFIYLCCILLICFLNKEIECVRSRSGSIATRLSCKSETENGNFVDVDWVAVYKPQSAFNGYYYHSKDNPVGWKLSNKDLKKSDSIMGRIFEQISNIIKDTKDKPMSRPISYIQYNDKIPGGTKVVEIDSASVSSKKKNADFGNLKGALVWNQRDKSAIWISHSLPNYLPPFSGQYSYPKSSNAHLFLCINIQYKDIVSILTSLMKMNVKIYEKFAINDEEAKLKLAKENSIIKESLTKVVIKSSSSLTALKIDNFEAFTTAGDHPTPLKMIIKPKREEGDFYEKIKNELITDNQIVVKTNHYIANFSAHQKICNQRSISYVSMIRLSTAKWRYNLDGSEFILSGEEGKNAFCFANTRSKNLCTKYGFSICLFDQKLNKTFLWSTEKSNWEDTLF